jgi:hypothetical protein
LCAIGAGVVGAPPVRRLILVSTMSPTAFLRSASSSAAVALVLALMTGAAAAQGGAVGPAVCGGFPKADNGPHDYRTVRDRRLSTVEKFHFTRNVETLTRGSSSDDVGGDLSFTLRAFPNHHRALLSMVRLGERLKSEQPPGATYSVECWLERAVRFSRDDAVARMIYASYLSKRGRTDDALVQMDAVAAIAGDSPFTHYNAGLLLVDMKQFDRALVHAHRAYALGFSRPDLKDKLVQAGKWRDAPPAAAEAAASAASAPPAPAAPAPSASSAPQ